MILPIAPVGPGPIIKAQFNVTQPKTFSVIFQCLNVVLQLPDLKDAEAVQKFFLEEIQLGEELLAQGKTPHMLVHDTDTGLFRCGSVRK